MTRPRRAGWLISKRVWRIIGRDASARRSIIIELPDQPVRIPAGVEYRFVECVPLGARFKIVAGYPGTREINLAMEKGEVQGGCGQTWSSVAATYPAWFRDKLVKPLVQEANEGYPELNAMGVKLARDFGGSGGVIDKQAALLHAVIGAVRAKRDLPSLRLLATPITSGAIHQRAAGLKSGLASARG